jgi:hypothetical protein
MLSGDGREFVPQSLLMEVYPMRYFFKDENTGDLIPVTETVFAQRAEEVEVDMAESTHRVVYTSMLTHKDCSYGMDHFLTLEEK